MHKAYIFGSGGHARVIASFLSCEVVFLVEGDAVGADQIKQSVFFNDNPLGDVYLGIGNNEVRARIFDKLMSLGRTPSICVAPNSFVARDASIMPGAVICAGAVIGSRANIGENVIVNTLSSLDHDCTLGRHTQVTVGVTFGGTVAVGENCFFGMKSAIFPGVTIGDNSKIMAGSLVVKDVPCNVLVGGSPARIIREI